MFKPSYSVKEHNQRLHSELQNRDFFIVTIWGNDDGARAYDMVRRIEVDGKVVIVKVFASPNKYTTHTRISIGSNDLAEIECLGYEDTVNLVDKAIVLINMREPSLLPLLQRTYVYD